MATGRFITEVTKDVVARAQSRRECVAARAQACLVTQAGDVNHVGRLPKTLSRCALMASLMVRDP